MGIKIDYKIKPVDLEKEINYTFELSGSKILSLEKTWNPANGAPVFTVRGIYTSRGWTEWTQGFQFGSALLQFDAMSGEPQCSIYSKCRTSAQAEDFLIIGREGTLKYMGSHLTHIGVHDHGFNNVSTYGNLLRLAKEGKIECSKEEIELYKLALKVSGAVQGSRWTNIAGGLGFIYSFNGPHSLFIDTIRTLRALALAYKLGHFLMGEGDKRISLLTRLILHILTTINFNIYFGNGRDIYDVRGRVAHESIFNVNNGSYRCPNSQQGFSPFTTWTRGLAWAILGLAEQLEFLKTLSAQEIETILNEVNEKLDRRLIENFNLSFLKNGELTFEGLKKLMLDSAIATADFYIENSCTDGVPYWDTGAPYLYKMGDYLNKPSDPFNKWEPVDSSAAAITAQGLIRLGNYITADGNAKIGKKYRQAGLTITRTLLNPPYISTDKNHQGLLLHSVYHRPRGWDYIPKSRSVPSGESSMWGDYHLRELCVMLLKEIRGEPYLTFFNICLD